MAEQNKISIIIPVYKAEKYLSKCVESVLSQTYSNWELLLIDDGSPDNSGVLCDEYASKDERIRAYHKENGGVSSARNYGLEKLTGEWVTFIDADDWLDSNALRESSKHFEDNDIVRFSMELVFDTKNLLNNRRKQLIPSSDKKEILGRVLSRKSILGVCGTVCRSVLFTGVRFNTNLVMAEDWLVTVQLMNNARSIRDLSDCFYFYNQLNEENCSNNPSVRKVENCLEALELIEDELTDTKEWENVLRDCHCSLAKTLVNTILKSENTPCAFIQAYKKELIKFTFPPKNDIVKSSLKTKEKFFLLLSFNKFGLYSLSILSYLNK